MGQKEFLSRLGFRENPFQFTNADQEEHLQSYFIPPPYFDSVWGDPEIPKSQVVFAPRGGGKSAQRRMIEHKADGSDVFTVTYDRFEHLGDVDLTRLGLDYHIGNIMQLGLLGFLLEYHARRMAAPAFSASEREQVTRMCECYLGTINRAEALEALKSLKTLSAKAKEFLRDWSGPVNALITTALSSQGLASGRVDSVASPHEPSVDKPTKAHLEMLRDLFRTIGFKSVYILVDKVDETDETGNDAEASFFLVRPMLRDLELLQLKGVCFKFFLWDELESHHREFARPDRIEQFQLAWTPEEIDRMLSRRLEVFSDGGVNSLAQLTDVELAEPLHALVVVFSGGSPRDMVRVCQEILAEQLQVGPEEAKIGASATVRGISSFCVRRAQELLPEDTLRELTKTGRVDFTTSYVANDVFKIDVNSARNKISRWTKTGAVEKVGELRTGGRPIHHYAITDPRIAKAILPQVSLGDFVKNKLGRCSDCNTVLIRDWDLQPQQTCHRCGAELESRT